MRRGSVCCPTRKVAVLPSEIFVRAGLGCPGPLPASEYIGCSTDSSVSATLFNDRDHRGFELLRNLYSICFPFLLWWPEVNRSTLRIDFLAGITGAIVVLPQGVAFATIAGMPPVYGLYAAMVPAIIAALFGSSRQLVSGPTTAASIVLFSTLSAFAVPGTPDFVRYALTLTFMVGLLQLGLGLARLGALVNFISHSVITGFTAGAALLIAASQAKHFLGLEMPRGLYVHEVLIQVLTRLDEIDVFAAVVGIVTLLSGIVARRRWPKVPYMIVAMICGTGTAFLLQWLVGSFDGAPVVELVGDVPAGLPPLSSPDFSFSTMQQLAPAAVAVTLFALTEAVSIARSMATRTGDMIDGNQEFIGQGLSNVVGSFFSSYVATGSFNRSGVNFEAGARTPLAAIFAGVLLIGIVPLVASGLAYLPKAAMSSILFLVAYGIIDFSHIRQILRASPGESLVLGSTFFATLFLALDFAILLGVFVSLVAYLYRASHPGVVVRVPDPRAPRRRLTTDPSLPECPQLRLVRIDGPLFFGAIAYVAERLRLIANRPPRQRHLLVLARQVSFMDSAGAEMLGRENRLRKAAGGQLYFHQLTERNRALLDRMGIARDIGGEDVFFESKGEAIATIFKRLEPEICQRCTARIFNECKSVPPPPPP